MTSVHAKVCVRRGCRGTDARRLHHSAWQARTSPAPVEIRGSLSDHAVRQASAMSVPAGPIRIVTVEDHAAAKTWRTLQRSDSSTEVLLNLNMWCRTTTPGDSVSATRPLMHRPF